MSTACPDTIVINGSPVDVSGVPMHQSILAYLRGSGRTGSKEGCNEGDCGACTILLLEKETAPRAINGCLALVSSLVGKEIVTSEGIARDGELHPVQKAMITRNGSQCGYCTPGFICSMAEVHERGASSREAIADHLCGNLCRCTGYRPIREAMLEALEEPAAPLPRAVELPVAASATTAADGTWLRPATIREALEYKQGHPGSSYIAGATELAVVINKRHTRYETLISLDAVSELREISSTADAWKIGAAAPLTDVEDALAGEYPVIGQLMRLFASRQIRHRATLGGNLVTASPIADSPPVLLALDASVVLTSLTGERVVPLSEFFTGYRQTVLRADEIMSAILLPRNLPGRCEFQKVSKRREMDISTVSAAFRVETDAAGIVTTARLAFGGVAATPLRALKTEEALVGKPLEATADILELLASEFTPLTDLRGSADYRKVLIKGLFRKFAAGLSAAPIADFGDTTFPPQAGRDMPHESAKGHVTGHAIYAHDIALRRSALEVWLVRSPHAHAKIERLDVSKAKSAPGVATILTAADVPGLNNTGPARHDEPLFATDLVQYHGQVVAAIIGESTEACRLAAALMEVDYTPLPPMLGIEAAIAAESFHTEPHFLVRGDIETALTESPQVLEGRVDVGGQEHFYLESQAAWAEPDNEGGVHVCSSTQHPSEIQTIVAEILGLHRHRVVVESPRMGGGFGGKETQGNAFAAICALGALATGKLVGLQTDRDHDMELTGKRHPFHARYKVGYHPDGRIHAADVQLYSDGGWSLDLSLPVNDRGLFHLDNAYYIPNVRFRGQVAKTNVTSHTAFRGFGGPQGMVVIEEIMGRIAGKLGLPPEQVREVNLYHGSGETNTTHYGEHIDDNRITRIWQELMASSDFNARRAEIAKWNAASPDMKRGIAITPVKFGISFTLKHYNQAGALVLVYADGSVQVNHGGTEMGQGLHTKILGVAMRELGLPAESIRLMHTRTDKVPNTSATAASSGSDLNGMAVADACRQLRERLIPLAAEILSCSESSVTFADGQVHNSAGVSISFETLASTAYTRRIQLSAAGFYATPELEWDWNVGKGRPFHYYAFGAAVSEVEIDGYTGTHVVRRVDILHDVGDSLNPQIDRGQVEGAFVQGMGWLTSEELKWNAEGKLLTHSASTYAIPAFSDAPVDFRVSLLSSAAQKNTIHGSKAVGEPPLMLAISVKEAIRDAAGAFGIEAGFVLNSPCTGETVMKVISGEALPEAQATGAPPYFSTARAGV